MHRIERNREIGTNNTRTPVFLMHGLLESSHGWIALGRKHSLGNKYEK